MLQDRTLKLWNFPTEEQEALALERTQRLGDSETALRKFGFIAVVWLKFRGYRFSMEFCGSVERSNFFSEDKFFIIFTCQALPMPFTPELSLQVEDQFPAEFGWSQVFKSDLEAFSLGLDGDRCLRTKTAKPLPCVLVVLVFRWWPQVDLGILLQIPNLDVHVHPRHPLGFQVAVILEDSKTTETTGTTEMSVVAVAPCCAVLPRTWCAFSI